MATALAARAFSILVGARSGHDAKGAPGFGRMPPMAGIVLRWLQLASGALGGRTGDIFGIRVLRASRL